MRSRGASAGYVALVALTACTDPGASALVWEPFVPAEACAVEQEVFGPYCVSCHDGTIEPLDLRGPALATLANEVGDWGEVLVVPGDPNASFIYTKCTGPRADQGELMPEGRALPESALAALRDWIAEGAPACEAGGDDIIVGGPVDFGGPPSGFVASRPSWAGAGACASAQWWSHSGMYASGDMHPGHDCLGCHAQAGGPGFTFAGTVYPTLRDPDDCRGVPGVTVEILDHDGVAIDRTVSNEAGNFVLRQGGVGPFRARLSYQGRTREMSTGIPYGGCNACHGPAGDEGAPGRVVAP